MSNPAIIVLTVAACAGSFWWGRQHPAKGRTKDGSPEYAITREAALLVPDVEENVSFNKVKKLSELIISSQSRDRVLDFQLGVRELDESDLKELWHHAAGHLDFSGSDERTMAIALLRRLVQFDPNAAIAFAADAGRWKSDILPEVIASWAMVDQKAAMEWIATAGADVKSNALIAVVEAKGDSDREGAIALYRKAVADGIVAKSIWSAGDFFREWAKSDPGRALNEAVAFFEFTNNKSGQFNAIEVWAKSNPTAAQLWLDQRSDSLSKEMRKNFICHIVDGWSDTSPSDATSYLLQIKDPKIQESAAHYLLRDWTARSFDEAKTWIATVDDPKRRHLFEYVLMDATRRRGDPTAAIEYGISKFDEHSGMYHAIFMQADVEQYHPDDAIKWIKETLPEEMQGEIMASVSHSLRRTNIEMVPQYLDFIPDPHRRLKHYHSAGRVWAEENMDAARDWANGLPDSDARDRAIAGVANVWIERMPEQAAEWINTLGPGGLRDTLASDYAAKLASDDPIAAMEMASSIEHPHERDLALENAMRGWIKKEPDTAREIIRTSDAISETARWRLLEGRTTHDW